jgi:hypothetical protein
MTLVCVFQTVPVIPRVFSTRWSGSSSSVRKRRDHRVSGEVAIRLGKRGSIAVNELPSFECRTAVGIADESYFVALPKTSTIP